jgi:hypothetical protein
MRVLALAACAAVLFASDQANAACSKGLLWPYVRNPGDCLTDAEITAGKTGVYSGPVNTAPDVSAIRIIEPAQDQAGASSPASGQPTATSGRGLFDTIGGGRGLFDTIGLAGLFGGSGAVTTTATSNGEAFSCNKGYFWPFYRSPGDCLTDIEKKNGRTGVYGGASGLTPVDARTSTVASALPNASTPVASTSAAGGAVTDTGAAGCHKGLLWPFLRDAGDCPTDAEKKSGLRVVAPAAVSSNVITSAPAGVAAMPVVSSTGTPAMSASPATIMRAEVSANRVTTVPAGVQMSAASAPASGGAPATAGGGTAGDAAGAASCRKGLLWPFIRSAGDCPTDDDKKMGRTTYDPSAVTPASASANTVTTAPARAEVPGASVTSAAPASSGGAPSSGTDTGCRKGFLWPFIRGASDCPTDDDKKIGRSTFDPAAVTPAAASAAEATPVSASGGKPMSSGATPASDTGPAGCSKGLLWPFVRSAGDCPTDDERAGRR